MPFPFIRVAHRGASAECPENTLLAFRRAMEHGVEALELDIHLTKDHELVVIHDDTLDRTTNGLGWVRDFTLAEIRQWDAGQEERIPTLAEVYQLVQPTPVRLCVEIKGETLPEELKITEAVVQSLKQADFLGRVIVTSFSPQALLRVRALEPTLPTMLDPSPQDGSLTPREICEQTLRAGANCLSFDHHFVTPAVAEAARLAGLALFPWAPNSPEAIRPMLQLGVPGLMTDRPDVLNQVLHDFTF
ncbi:MAG TPA: glycerophosphodiester phosphodiesterase family protein [Anaerolineales bacterium]|nr:glycerophosphodiester phosphodiesterase family protein [Anaerolineales bacterium]